MESLLHEPIIENESLIPAEALKFPVKKKILPKKEWKRRQARRKQQKHSRKANRK